MQFSEILLPPGEILETLLALALCGLLTIRAVLVGLRPRAEAKASKGRVALEGFFCLTSVLVACFLAVDVLQAFIIGLDRSVMLLAGISAVLGVLLFSAVTCSARFGGKIIKPGARFVLQTCHIGLLLCACCYFAFRTKDREQPHLGNQTTNSQNLMQEHSEYLAITDTGTQVPLYDINVRNQSQETRDFLTSETHTPAGAKVIPRADANINANCHGVGSPGTELEFAL